MNTSPNQITSVAQLLQWIAAGHRPKYIFFWGHRQDQSGNITKSCLSNWYPASFTLEGITYPTTEHYMMAQKALLFNDAKNHARILKANTPGEAKKLGRSVRGFDENVWRRHRFEIMVRGNEAKFSQNEALKNYLLSTHTRILVEASPTDRIWGIGMAASNPNIENPNAWKGLNLLGFALVEARRRLFEKEWTIS